MIEVQNLTKHYGPVTAIQDVSFRVAPGEIVGFLGPNGAGKSTTMRILSCFMPASGGSARVAGYDVFRESMEVLKPVKLTGDDVAFLQFTSGSTSRPKGVSLTHANLMANVKCITYEGLKMHDEDVGVSWLPLFHDMGLIGFVLSPIVMRTPIVFLPPLLFLKRPVSWLQALTRHKGTISFGPNFAYALCVKRIRERELEGIQDILGNGNGADRQLRVFNANRDVAEVMREIADATEVAAAPA